MDAQSEEKPYYTYADYLTWDDDKRWEIIDGSAYLMSPAPSWGHQSLSGNLHLQLANFLKGKQCKVFTAPFDVRLNADTKDDTVVQPDLAVICDKTRLIGTGYIGAPDMVIEILSPSTAQLDRFIKLMLYQRAGVREYWIVDPDIKAVNTHILENGKYYVAGYTGTDTVPVHVLEGCTIDLSDVFED